MATPDRVGFIGLGIMGQPMARNLLKAGFPLTVHNRHQSVTDAFVAAGARAALLPREVATDSDVVITMLPDTPVVEEVLTGPDGVLAGAREGLVVIDMSTISPVTTRALAARLAQQGVQMLDAPVSGGDRGAIAATLGRGFSTLPAHLSVAGQNRRPCGGKRRGPGGQSLQPDRRRPDH